MFVRAECFLAICAARVAVRLFPRLAIARAVNARGSERRGVNAEEIAETFARVVERHPLSTNCLHRALALHAVLMRRGVDARLRIGARRAAPHFPGHAWVEAGGVALNEACSLDETWVALVHG
jgi:hypothetical protein